MDKYTEFERSIQSEGYITTPYEIIYDVFPDATSYDVIEGQRMILVHNHRLSLEISDENEKLNKIINNASDLQEKSQEPQETIKEEQTLVDNQHTYPQSAQALQIIKSLEFYSREEFNNQTKQLPQSAIYLIKLYLYKKINDLKKIIKNKAILSPESDLTEEQVKLITFQEFLDDLTIEQEILIEEQQEKDEFFGKNIILVPNGKSTTYILEDIREYPESYDEISNAFENIMTKRFLSSKSISSIKDMGEKLYEYKRKNGIRILYIQNGNDIFICNMFYKDKQRSTKISSYYEEAIKRYYSFINTNTDITTPDFIIEQKELSGQIYGELEQSSVLKISKGGE